MDVDVLDWSSCANCYGSEAVAATQGLKDFKSRMLGFYLAQLMLSESFGHIRNDEAAWKQHGPICWHVVSSYIVLTCSHKISQVVVEPLSPLWSLFSQVICGPHVVLSRCW